jgi:guanylate kinase
MTPKNVNSHIIEDLVDKEGDESSVAEARRMMIIMFTELKEELKEDIQKQHNESQENVDKKFKKSQKQLNKHKEDFNKH